MKNCPYCGQQNSDEVRFCGKCGKEIIETPQESPNNEMNHTQQEQSSDTTAILSQKKRSKKKYLWIPVFLFLIASGIAFYFLGYPYIQYQQAISDLEAGNYDTATEIFTDLGDYRDARMLVENIEDAKSCLRQIDSLKVSIYESFDTLKTIESCWQKHFYKYATGEYKNTFVIFGAVIVEVGEKQEIAKTQKSSIDEEYNTILSSSKGIVDSFLSEAINCATEMYNAYCSYYEFVEEPRGDHSYLTYVDENEERCNELESLFDQINYYINRQ